MAVKAMQRTARRADHRLDRAPKHLVLSTKANTLRSLRPLLKNSRIERIFTFHVGDWQENPVRVLKQIREEFGRERVVVRSSVVNEDTYHSSQAGAFRTELNISTQRPAVLQAVIERVISSYSKKESDSPANQVLVQPHVQDVQSSGVVFTRNPRTGSSYYIINYDDRTGQTESVTGGLESDTVEVFRGCPPERWPAEWWSLLKAVRELEEIVPNTPLGIEFCIDASDRVVVFQVRPLVLSDGRAPADSKKFTLQLGRLRELFRRRARPVAHLAGKTTVFSDMAFWNPAEMLGDRPGALAMSLYKHLITDSVWHKALERVGYEKVGPAPLLAEFGGKPYIDIRATFNALLPAGLPKGLRKHLVCHYIEVLREHPELHDKVEFEVVDNCYHFSLPRRLQELRRAGFEKRECETLLEALRCLTAQVLRDAPELLREAEADCSVMEKKRKEILATLEAEDSSKGKVSRFVGASLKLLDDCKRFGTLPFSRVARMAFMGRALLGSLADAGVDDDFMGRVYTVAQEMSDSFQAVLAKSMSRKVFMQRYGHLRPGTYDICSPRYDKIPGFFEGDGLCSGKSRGPSKAFELAPHVHTQIGRMLSRHSLPCGPEELLGFIKATFEARERIKFEFTKNLSEALELLAQAGEELGLSREELAHLDVSALRRAARQSRKAAILEDWSRTIGRNQGKKARDEQFSLPPLLFSDANLEVMGHHRSKPNFITRKSVLGRVALLDGNVKVQGGALKAKVVLVEKADPGYDWIFTKSISGLITKYGGVASHMAIRCAEFGLPAAIGCGEQMYRGLLGAKAIVLNCEKGQIKVV